MPAEKRNKPDQGKGRPDPQEIIDKSAEEPGDLAGKSVSAGEHHIPEDCPGNMFIETPRRIGVPPVQSGIGQGANRQEKIGQQPDGKSREQTGKPPERTSGKAERTEVVQDKGRKPEDDGQMRRETDPQHQGKGVSGTDEAFLLFFPFVLLFILDKAQKKPGGKKRSGKMKGIHLEPGPLRPPHQPAPRKKGGNGGNPQRRRRQFLLRFQPLGTTEEFKRKKKKKGNAQRREKGGKNVQRCNIARRGDQQRLRRQEGNRGRRGDQHRNISQNDGGRVTCGMRNPQRGGCRAQFPAVHESPRRAEGGVIEKKGKDAHAKGKRARPMENPADIGKVSKIQTVFTNGQ